MAGRALVVIDEALRRQSAGLRTMASDAAARRAVVVDFVTFEELFADPATHLFGATAVALTARTLRPSETSTYFRPTQTPAACAASLAVTAGARRVTAVLPSTDDDEFPLLLAMHLCLAGADVIFDIIDVMSHEHADAMVDSTVKITGGRTPTQTDLDNLHRRISAVKDQGHPGWRFDRFNLSQLRKLAAKHPTLAAVVANEAIKIAVMKKSDRSLFTALERDTGPALGHRRAATAKLALFDLRAFLAFDLHPRTLEGQGRTIVVRSR